MSSPSILDDMEKQKQAFAPVALPVDDTPLDEERAKWEAEFFFEYEAEIRMKVIASHTAGIAIANAAKTAINASQSAQRATRHLNRDILGISKEARVKRLFKYLIIVHLIVVALAIAAFNTPYIMKSIQTTPDIYNTTESFVHIKQRIEEDISHAKVMAELKSEIDKQKMELEEMKSTHATCKLVQLEIGEKLHIAIINGETSIVKILINAGADVNVGYDDWVPIFLAYKHKKSSIVELLINAGANLNVRNTKGDSPLKIAIINRESSIVELLINAGANVNEKDTKEDTKGDSPLHLACTYNEPSIVELLINAGCDVNAKNNKGAKPQHMLRDRMTRKHFQCLTLLRTAGATGL